MRARLHLDLGTNAERALRPGPLAQRQGAHRELLGAADVLPDAVALVDGEARLTYRSLAARADALASRLVDDLGLVREDRIVVQLPNCWQFVVLTVACLRAGIVPVMALPAHRQHELRYLAEHSEAAALALADERVARVIGLVLTPHVCHPMPRDGHTPDEEESLFPYYGVP